MKLETGKIYIFDRKKHHKSAPFKGKVEDITKHTYLIKDLDHNTTVRYDIEEFKDEWRMLEEVEEKDSDLKPK